MIGKKRICQTVQKTILEDDGRLRKHDRYVNHINSCEECSVFVAHLRLMRSSTHIDDTAFSPRPEIIHKLRNRFKEDVKPKLNIQSAIKAFFNYPIPAYQVVGGIILILCVIFGYRIASESGQTTADMNDSFYLADTTRDPAHTFGESVNEDTIWVQHMVTF
jgi:hypothetical protein